LYHDIGKICSFLSRRDSVLTNLAPLNAAIKKELEKPGRKQLSDRMEEALRTNNGQPLRNDTGKLLSGILDEFEHSHGFNAVGESPAMQTGKLHTTAFTAGNATDAIKLTGQASDFTAYNPEGKAVKDLRAIPLPKGAPTLTGVLEKSFNPVLLRHGYHWKDPGADSLVHGEFTHRLQWFAIVTAAATIGLINRPLEIFKSMGYASFTTAKNEGKNTYLWMLCCDCFAENQKSSNPGQPWSKTFTCPNVLQSYLSNSMGAWVDLPYLRAVMSGRYLKRQRENNPAKTDERISSGDKQVRFAITSPEDKGGAIWWRKR